MNKEKKLIEILLQLGCYNDIIAIKRIMNNQKLSQKKIRRLANNKDIYLDWKSISKNQRLSSDFIIEFEDKLDWNYISKHQKLSEDLIRMFKNKVNWYCVSRYQNLSEEFIIEFSNRVDWEWITRSQNLSEKFILNNYRKVVWYWIINDNTKKYSKEFIEKFKKKVGWYK